MYLLVGTIRINLKIYPMILKIFILTRIELIILLPLNYVNLKSLGLKYSDEIVYKMAAIFETHLIQAKVKICARILSIYNGYSVFL